MIWSIVLIVFAILAGLFGVTHATMAVESSRTERDQSKAAAIAIFLMLVCAAAAFAAGHIVGGAS